MKKSSKLTLALQQLILYNIINRANDTEKSRGTFYTTLIELVQIPLCYRCLRALKVGQYVCGSSGGSKMKKYYHDICYGRLWQ